MIAVPPHQLLTQSALPSFSIWQLAAMRAAIFASLIPAPEDDAEREKLEELIKVIVDWDQVKDGNSPKIEEAKEDCFAALEIVTGLNDPLGISAAYANLGFAERVVKDFTASEEYYAESLKALEGTSLPRSVGVRAPARLMPIVTSSGAYLSLNR